MIQELFGGGAGGFIAGEKRNPINGGVNILGATPSPSSNSLHSSASDPSSRTSAPAAVVAAAGATSSTTATPTTSNSENQNLRCPRCDSSNTKFCYYNNYNLTQPRHFCKTCRRYWTKGGALRNIPIGGGCRKNKNASISNTVSGNSFGKTSSAIAKIRSEIGNRSPMNLWASSQSSQLLSLLRPGFSPNSDPNPISDNTVGITVKDEGSLSGTNGVLNGRALGCLEHPLADLGQVPSLGLCSSLWRNISSQQCQNTPHLSGFVQLGVGEVQSSGIHQLYQTLRSVSYNDNSNYYNSCTDHNSSTIVSNLGSSSSLSASESAPVGGGEFGYPWNSTLSWSDHPTTNGAYP